MVFTPCSDGKFQGTSPFGVIGVRYTVTAVLPDPNSNGTPAEYPNDQATLTGPVDAVLWPTATATIPNTWFKNAYRTS